MPTSHSRAALIGLGGWGLQTMLHLWPRLSFIQEGRQALGIDHQLPDLGKLTAYATLIPNPVTPEEARLEGYRPFSLVRPNPERFPEPFYLERHARQVEQAAWSQQTARLTPAERTAAYLLKQAREEQHVLDVRVNRPPTRQRLEPSSRVSRAA
ncbi:MAG: hypothetical protein M3220_05790, partial [Chloroflexota bacterium]|nr:hypothetical protein [Chloroflexota bacterium]